MKISLIIPTNRTSYSAIARVLELAALDPDKFEVIVRDNSENAKKRALLSMVDSSTLRLFTVPNRGAFENCVEALRLSTGEFVLFLADDDWVSCRGAEHLYLLATENEADQSVGSVTGGYLIESSAYSGVLKYSGIDSPDPVQRLSSYLQANAPNLLYYSAARRSLMSLCYAFLESVPYSFSFHDQLMSMLYLVMGRVVQIDRVLYVYDLGDWETSEGTLSKDRACYANAGLPIEVDRLHWLICGLEGALLLNSRWLGEKATFDRPRMSDIWFSTNFTRFKHWGREFGYAESAANVETRKIREKWVSASEANLNELLIDICNVFEIVDKDGAQRYFNFWSTL